MLDAAMKRHRFRADALIEVLHTAQELFGYLTADVLHLRRPRPEAAAQPRLRRGDVLSSLHLDPKGRTPVSSAWGPPATSRGPTLAGDRRAVDSASCRVRRPPTAGSRSRPARCLGACGLAPVVVFDGKVGGNQNRGIGPTPARRMVTRMIHHVDLEAIADAERAARKPDRIRGLHGRRLPVARSRGASATGSSRSRTRAAWATGSRSARSAACGSAASGPLVQVDPAGPLYETGRRPGRRDPRRGHVTAQEDGGPGKRPARRPAQPVLQPGSTPSCLENCGLDRARADRVVYRRRRATESLYHVLHEMSPAEVVAEVTRSGLRGRGGAGYPTG